jgi:Holliday junction DNA helicase RuvA
MSMIAGLKGTVDEKGRDHVVVDVHGVCYHVSVPGSTLAHLGAVGDAVSLRTYLYVREDTIQLYGFQTAEEKASFERLLSVTGIGPRGALAFLTQFSPAELAGAIERRDAAALTRVKGIGRKTAERLLVELTGKLTSVDGTGAGAVFGAGFGGDEALAVLLSLGYSLAEANAALASTPPAAQVATEERVVLALRALDSLRG